MDESDEELDSRPGTQKSKKQLKKGVPKPLVKKGPPKGGAFVRMIMKKGGKDGGPLKIEDLDESILAARLKKLDAELAEYRENCDRYKKENEWYREEIETTQRDTAEYIAYLESKKSEKLNAINSLSDSNKRDIEQFLVKRKQKEQENQEKIHELKDLITELEMKLHAKQAEILLLSDTMARRAKHEAEMGKIRKEMQNDEEAHQARMAEMEKSLLETRMKLQKEADAKIRSMESAAHEKAAKYLADHTIQLEAENTRLEAELRRVTKKTHELVARKEAVDGENKELLRELKLRQDLIHLRLKKVAAAEERETNQKFKRKAIVTEKQKRVVENALSKKGLSSLNEPLALVPHLEFLKPNLPDAWLDIEDNDDSEYI